MKLASRGLEQNLIEKVDLARSLQDLSDERKEELERLTKLYEKDVSQKDKTLDELRLKLNGDNQQKVKIDDMERLKKAHADALNGKEMELQKLRELLENDNKKKTENNEIPVALNEQISQLKVEHSEAL